MNIMERYLCAYIIMCISGDGETPEYIHSVLGARTKIRTKNPLLLKTLEVLTGKDSRAPETKAEVANVVKGWMNDRTNIRKAGEGPATQRAGA